ncbi:MAG: penicillin-binding protein 1A [Betaproteobacteria bacterium]|nr:penicillin-binding protein 1A [Betaproteobacteria bacterium]
MRWLLYPLAALLALAIIGLATLTVICLLAWPNLPPLDTLTDYRPSVPMRVYTADGHLISEFGEERRTLVRIQDVPAHLRQALLAAEDKNFYEHSGIDFISFTRAFINNMRSGSRGQGGSTITMQVARNFFLTRERSYNRKLYEILLALKIEHNLGKDQILELYINQIFLGQRAYGFSAAAQIYFGKPLDKLTLAETAMLAGLPQAPSAANPISNFESAQQRQRYVLRRMLEAGFISEAQYKQALDEPLRISSRKAAGNTDAIKSSVHAGYVAEIARQIAIEQFGEQITYQSGLKIITTITRAEQEAAYGALRKGVMDYDRRHGYRGPEKVLSLPPGAPNESMNEEIALARDFGDLLAAVVLAATPKEVTVYRNGRTISINGDGLRFAAPLLSEKASQTRRVRRGALVRIRKSDQGWELTQLPEAEAALLSIDSKTGAVRALVGGFDYDRKKFNNVTQAERQPGSSFKPFIYSASLEKGYAPGTLIADEPLFYPAGGTTVQEWSPRNYDNKYSGIITLRDALAHSKNIPAIRVLEDISPSYAQQYIRRFGFDAAHHPPYLAMALGTGSVTPWEMAAAYAVFANGGYRINPYVIKEIRDGNDKPLARTKPLIVGEGAQRVIDARNAWVMTSLLQDVVRRGTAARARSLNRNDLAGKTGTTNDFVDAWFCGYNPKVVAVSWIGFPIPRNLGKGETGGTAALPIWIDYMRTALAGMPETSLPRPTGIASAKVLDGQREDFYYAENKPPALKLPPKEEDSVDPIDWFSSLFGLPSSSERREAPRQQRAAPVEDRSFIFP